jgi:hypothetical protein
MVRKAKADPTRYGYQQGAQIAQAMYVMFEAQYFGEVKP